MYKYLSMIPFVSLVLYLRICSSYMSIKGGISIEQPNLSLNRDLEGALS